MIIPIAYLKSTDPYTIEVYHTMCEPNLLDFINTIF